MGTTIRLVSEGQQTMKATEVAELIAEAPMSLEDKLSWHATQFDTPIPPSLLPLLKSAIELVNNGGDIKSEYLLPADVVFRKGKMVSAEQLIKSYHLEYYITQDKEELMGKMNDLHARGVADLTSYQIGRQDEREAIIEFISLSFDGLDSIPASVVLAQLTNALKELE